MSLPEPPEAWADLPFFATDWPRIAAALAEAPEPWQPAPADIFRALALTAPEAVRVVILGQDPYHTPGRATGLAFAFPPGAPPRDSLANILKELAADTGLHRRDGDLTGWARQGVLLLNTVLTVPLGQAHGHRRLGWQRLAAEVLGRAATRPAAFLLWGKPALDTCAPILARAPSVPRLVLASSHPSPLSAARRLGPHPPFRGSRPFGAVNRWLAARGEAPVDWAA